ncbi:glycoside hydrolase superfamily [Dioszegia hungarica]|uniref:Glycoside hydrolase superfamily n=1 Tax=Dioszegia hungarica TaxID=4972 RepID=A0AA38H6X1_9TREE|nr:glycoside hydrolase superfamily [Dioszegia hungarica]KAI9635318.1 glycoside hydrolase superfamily [Dioszegia hungarica]
MAEYLTVKGSSITLGGEPILLKGAALAGWMNMENFITGYAGHEFQVRAELRKRLGDEKYTFFFDKFLEYFFTEEDAKLFSSLGLNCIRIPINYRHFEDDLNPRVIKESGFKHLDRVIDLCAKHKIYTVIDLHAAPGGQNNDWHSDAGNHQANFWVHRDFQDRAVNLWEHIAKRYKDNTWVAGYNSLNEPTDEEHTRLLDFYARVEKAIRAIDPHHILFLDGNNFGADFSRFAERPLLPNVVYACHDYSSYGFPSFTGRFTRTAEQVANHEKQFSRKVEFMRSINAPIWNGEFGPVYQNAGDGKPDWEEINDSRLAALKHQLEMYSAVNVSWSIWLWKDVGFQGMVYVSDDTPYMRLLKPFIEKKKRLAADSWGNDDRQVRHLFEPIEEWLLHEVPGVSERYPKLQRPPKRPLARLVREILLSEELVHEYGSYFEGKTMDELDELARSFSLSNCIQRSTLNEFLMADAKRTA